jgi:hypothetical protein
MPRGPKYRWIRASTLDALDRTLPTKWVRSRRFNKVVVAVGSWRLSCWETPVDCFGNPAPAVCLIDRGVWPSRSEICRLAKQVEPRVIAW